MESRDNDRVDFTYIIDNFDLSRICKQKIKEKKMAIHIKDIKQAITLIKETQVSLRRLSRLITNEDLRTLSAKVDRFLEEIEIDVYSY